MNDIERYEYRKLLDLVVTVTGRKGVPTPATLKYLHAQISKILKQYQ